MRPWVRVVNQTSILQGPDAVPNPWVDPGTAQTLWIQSPNCDLRPPDTDVDTVVLHATVLPTLEKTTRRFLDPESRVSAHYTIGKDGSIVQCVSPLNRAWHAGESLDSEGRTHVNDFSIGIELVNLNDGIDPYPVAQIDVLTNMLIGFRAMGFSLRYIASHEAVAMPRGRKSDPKGFPWEALENLGMALIR